jgi:DNA-binding beta-propeller fold protein YncE
VAVDGGGDVYVTDSRNHRVQKFTSTGGYLTQWGSYGDGDGQFELPEGVAVNDSGNVYVVDSDMMPGGYHHRIQTFTGTGAYLTRWGGYGHGNGEFWFPEGVAPNTTGSILVADFYNSRIQEFTSRGGYLSQWGLIAEKKGWGAQPAGIAVDANGNIYVAIRPMQRIEKFAPRWRGQLE